MVVTDENGCLLTTDYTITSAPNVVALFEADNQVIELDNGEATIEFSNISINATDFEWAFGDGSVHSFDENPTHTYTEAGVYTVIMKAWNDDCSASYQIVIQVQEIVTSIEVTTFNEGIEFYFQEDHLLISFDLPTAMNLEINGYNLLGQRILNPMIGEYSNEQIELQLTQLVHVGIITIYNRDTGEAKSFKIIH